MLMRAFRGLTPEKEDNFAILDTGVIDTQVGNFTGAIAMVVTPITLISLVVGRHCRHEHHAGERYGTNV